MLTRTVLEAVWRKEWNFAPLCRRVVATRTHWARIATMLQWQNISLCALLISRPTYNHSMRVAYSFRPGVSNKRLANTSYVALIDHFLISECNRSW